VLRTPPECFAGVHALGYTFDANYAHLPIGGGKTLPRVHYVDEGPRDGKVVLCLHGEPSWSFLYRKMIPIFVANGYRVIAPDFIGFGKSDKYSSAGCYTHAMHTMTLRLLLDNLSLTNINLVCQDWGGLTGLSVAKDMPDRFASITVMNTGMPIGQQFGDGYSFVKGLPFLLWQAAMRFFGRQYPDTFLFSNLLKFPRSVAKGYLAPFPDWKYKAGGAVWPLLVPILADDTVASDMVEVRQFITDWSKPILVMFSDRDIVTRGLDRQFMSLARNAQPAAVHKVIRGAGHFLQETHGVECAENIVSFLGDVL